MRGDAPGSARSALAARVQAWRRAATLVALCACICVGVAAGMAVAIAHRHDLARARASRAVDPRQLACVVGAAAACAAACAWIESRAARRAWTTRLDERLGLQGALCAAVDAAPTRLSEALAADVSRRLPARGLAGATCERLWPALLVVGGAGAAWLASESWLAGRAGVVSTADASSLALADELQRAALSVRSPELRAQLAAAAAAARRHASLELAPTRTPGVREDARADLVAELRELERAARAAEEGSAAGWMDAALRARSALEARDARSEGLVQADPATPGDGLTDAPGRGADARGEDAGPDRGLSKVGGATTDSKGKAGAGGEVVLASGAGGGTISTPDDSRGHLLAPTVLETLPAHEAEWLSKWAVRARAADAPPR